MHKNWNVQFKQQDCERVNLDRHKVDNSESCSEGRRVEREKSFVLPFVFSRSSRLHVQNVQKVKT